MVPDHDAALPPPGVVYSQQALGVSSYGSNPNLGHKPSIEIDVVPPVSFFPLTNIVILIFSSLVRLCS